MHSKTFHALAALGLAAFASVAPAEDTGAAVTVTATALLSQAPPTLSPAGEGRREFLKLNCYSCHGMRAQGGMGPNIVHAQLLDVRSAVTQGEEGGMRSFRHYTTKVDIKHLAAYLQSIGTSKEPTFNEWWVANPMK